MENPDFSMETRYTVEYFERALNEEKNRLQKLCKEWTVIQSQADITEDIRYQINQAVGQTTMLIKEKFKQFHGLILGCERKNNDMLITSTDLHGFWDMMYIEVKDCDSRFAKLEKLRARHWQEDQSSFAISTRPKEKIVTKKKVISAGKSSLPAFILPDKKKMTAELLDNKKNLRKEINVNNDKFITPCITNKRAVMRSSNASHNKRFLEICRNYMYTSTPLSTYSTTSNISNQLTTPLIAMKISQLYNKSTMLLNDTMQYITPERTPRKSSIEELERPKSKSLRMKLADKSGLNDYLTITKSSDEKLEISQNSEASSKKINKSDELNSTKRIHVEEKLDSGIDNSAQTMIEKTINDKNSILMLSSIKTPTKSKRSVKNPHQRV